MSTKKQYENLTKLTMTQSLSEKWMMYRAGRITASNCKKAYVMDIKKPALSTINAIMAYETDKETKAMKHGKISEGKARETYEKIESCKHDGLVVSNTGLHINQSFPYLGASPDGLVECKCHGKRLLEIKCPYKFKKSLSIWKCDTKCPVTAYNKMKIDHEYYYQIQMQMLVTEIDQCDFFVWSEGKKEHDTFLITIKKDENFCLKLKEKLENVFRVVILPELVTRENDPNNKKHHKLYCYCQRPSFPPMIGCDGLSCKIEWFHYSCLDLVRAPPEKKKVVLP